MDTIEGKLLRLFTQGTLDISSREPNYHQFLIFQDNQEQAEFNQFLTANFYNYPDIDIQNQYQYQIHEDTVANGGNLVYSAFHVAKCAKLYEDWLKTR